MTSSWLMVWIPTKETEFTLRPKLSPQTSVTTTIDSQAGLKIHITRVNSNEHIDEIKGKLQSISEYDTLEIEKEGRGKRDFVRSDSTLLSPADSEKTLQDKFVETSSLEETLMEVLKILRVKHFIKQGTEEGEYWLFSFCVLSQHVEPALIALQNHGIGNNEHTAVSVLNNVIHMRGEKILESPWTNSDIRNARGSIDANNKEGGGGNIEGKIEKFYETIKSRMLVAEVVSKIRSGGEFTFDFLMLLFLAGCIAFMGLLEASSVVLVASMLVSPLMGPILAGIFGAVIKDRPLRNQGIVNEVIALLICLATGLILGLIFVPWIEAYGVHQWPTSEMLSRGQVRSLWVGVLIAVPSGAGVALSVLSGNAGSLVGVAISASLLPPAVNCGLFWAQAMVSAMEGHRNYLIGFQLEEEFDPNSTLPIYEFNYSENLSVEAAVLGVVSFTLTLLNIICIIVTGILILKLKEVTPDKIPQSFSNFWKKDIRAHRDYYETFKNDPNSEELLQKAREVLGIGKSPEGLEGTFLHNIFEDAHRETNRINIRDWVAQPPVPPVEKPVEDKSPFHKLTKASFSRQNTITSDNNMAEELALRMQIRRLRQSQNLTDVSRFSMIDPPEGFRNRSYTTDQI